MCKECRAVAADHPAAIQEIVSATPSPTAATITELEHRYQRLLARSAKLNNYVQLRRRSTSEQRIQSEHDAISDEMTTLAVKLSSMSCKSTRLLKLKASLLLDLMPDEDDVGVFLAVSMCDDILSIEDAPILSKR